MKRLVPALFIVPLAAVPLVSCVQSGEKSVASQHDHAVPAEALTEEQLAAMTPAQRHFKKDVAPVFAKYCVSCHSGTEAEGELKLDFASLAQVEEKFTKEHKVFERMVGRLKAHEMPPEGQPQPTDAERQALLTWVDKDLLESRGLAQGPAPVARVRRLSRVEYNNTVRDLFYFKDFKAEDLPPDNLGYGFDNIADLLTITPNQMELYLKTAEQAMVELDKTCKVSKNWAEKDGTYWEPDDGVFLPIRDVKLGFNNNQTRVRMVVEKFLPRAYRRPVSTAEIDRMMPFAQLSLTQEGESFIRPKSTYAALRAALASPYFLYRIEEDPAEGTAPINEYALASRLSYFLWSSMPDDELFALAEKGELRTNLETQVRRMLKDPKARALTENFAEQWLHLAALKNASPDPKLYPLFDDTLRKAMAAETEQFITHVIQDDRPIMDFLDADYTFLNERLAKHYGIEGVAGDEMRMVKLNASQNRGGLLTQGSILTLTSPPTRTSPVKRGIWILQTLFNDPPSPPPDNVPPLEAKAEVVKGTFRQVLAAHRENPQCAGCHNKIDPFGVALESFDAIGAWRTKEGEYPIDTSGTLPGGHAYHNMAEFRSLLNSKKDDFRKAFVEQLMIYALGRGLDYGDRSTVRQVCTTAADHQDKFSSVVMAIVNSDVFQKRTARGN